MGGFVVLDKTEFLSKLKRLCQGAANIHLWKRGEKATSAVAHFVEEKGSGNLLLHFTPKDEMIYSVGQEILFYFIQNSVQYFSSGNLKRQENGWALEVIGEVFKREKRKNERLLTFPHHQVFVYFNFQKKQSPNNVIFLDQGLGSKKRILEKFLKRSDQTDGMTGFRVLDISLNGFSFTISKNEKLHFKEGATEAIQLHFNGLIYEISDVKIIHFVDYIDPRFGHVPMQKVGVHMLKPNELLRDKITQMLGEESKRVELSSEFENFFK